MRYQRMSDIKTTLMPDGHVVLFNTKTEWAQVLNPVGALVWEYCDGVTSLNEMIEEIASLLETDKNSLEDDVCLMLKELLSNGLIQESTAEKST